MNNLFEFQTIPLSERIKQLQTNSETGPFNLNHDKATKSK